MDDGQISQYSKVVKEDETMTAIIQTKNLSLNTLSTIDTFNEGEVLIESKSLLDMKKKTLREYRQKRMGFIFQDYNLLDTLTVKEIITTALGF